MVPCDFHKLLKMVYNVITIVYSSASKNESNMKCYDRTLLGAGLIVFKPPSIVGTAFRCHYIVFGSRPTAYVHEILQNQEHKPLPDGESVQPLSLLFHEQRSDVKLQTSTRIAKK